MAIPLNLDMQNLNTAAVAERIDARGLVCPMPTLRLGQAVKRIPVGGIVELWSDDPGAEKNMAAWTKHTGHELVAFSRQDGAWIFQFRRVH